VLVMRTRPPLNSTGPVLSTAGNQGVHRDLRKLFWTAVDASRLARQELA